MGPVYATCGFAAQEPLWELWRSPGVAVGIYLVLVLLHFMVCCTLVIGTQWCPAASGSIINTAVSMSLSYTVQVMFYRVVPATNTILGAAMLLLSIILLALARQGSSVLGHPCKRPPQAAPTSSTGGQGHIGAT